MILSAMKKNGISGGLLASINALLGASNGLMNIIFILIWINGCWGGWVLDTLTKKSVKSKHSSRTKSSRAWRTKANFLLTSTVIWIL